MKNASSTKRGPGRKHVSGHQKASPIKSRGAPIGFFKHFADTEKQARRNTMRAVGGRRQFLKKSKAVNREDKAYAAAITAKFPQQTASA